MKSAVGNDFARIEKVVRVESGLDFAHHAEQALANLLGHEFGARNADAVFAGQRAVELGDQRGNFTGKLAEFFQILA